MWLCSTTFSKSTLPNSQLYENFITNFKDFCNRILNFLAAPLFRWQSRLINLFKAQRVKYCKNHKLSEYHSSRGANKLNLLYLGISRGANIPLAPLLIEALNFDSQMQQMKLLSFFSYDRTSKTGVFFKYIKFHG